jgi:integrase/recombinase XerD
MRSPRRFFADGEMRDLLRRLRQKARGGRLIDKIDHALVTFAWATGCRASEIASASLDPRQPNWMDIQAGLVNVTDAKYDSRGTIPLDASSLRVIRHYVREVRPRLRNADVMHQLFLTKTGSPYTSNKMTKKMRMLLQRYGLEGKSAHSFRHFFCTDLLRRGVALHETKALMRHRDVRSTMVYSHATVDDLRAAVNRRIG